MFFFFIEGGGLSPISRPERYSRGSPKTLSCCALVLRHNVPGPAPSSFVMGASHLLQVLEAGPWWCHQLCPFLSMSRYLLGYMTRTSLIPAGRRYTLFSRKETRGHVGSTLGEKMESTFWEWRSTFIFYSKVSQPEFCGTQGFLQRLLGVPWGMSNYCLPDKFPLTYDKYCRCAIPLHMWCQMYLWHV